MNSCNKSTNFLQVLAITEPLLCVAQWPHWTRFGHQERDHTHKNPNPQLARAEPCGLCLHLNSSLSPWCAGQEVKQAAEPVVPRITLAALFMDALMLQLCKVHPLPSQEQWGKLQTSRWTCPFLGLWGTWGESPVLPPPHHTHQTYLPLLHSFTLDNANMLLTWVAEKWAIKRNTWENRRDSTEDQGTCFFSPRLT